MLGAVALGVGGLAQPRRGGTPVRRQRSHTGENTQPCRARFLTPDPRRKRSCSTGAHSPCPGLRMELKRGQLELRGTERARSVWDRQPWAPAAQAVPRCTTRRRPAALTATGCLRRASPCSTGRPGDSVGQTSSKGCRKAMGDLPLPRERSSGISQRFAQLKKKKKIRFKPSVCRGCSAGPAARTPRQPGLGMHGAVGFPAPRRPEPRPARCLTQKWLSEPYPPRSVPQAPCFPGRQNPLPFSSLLPAAQRPCPRGRESGAATGVQGRTGQRRRSSAAPRGRCRRLRASPLGIRQRRLKTSL